MYSYESQCVLINGVSNHTRQDRSQVFSFDSTMWVGTMFQRPSRELVTDQKRDFWPEPDVTGSNSHIRTSGTTGIDQNWPTGIKLNFYPPEYTGNDRKWQDAGCDKNICFAHEILLEPVYILFTDGRATTRCLRESLLMEKALFSLTSGDSASGRRSCEIRPSLAHHTYLYSYTKDRVITVFSKVWSVNSCGKPEGQGPGPRNLRRRASGCLPRWLQMHITRM